MDTDPYANVYASLCCDPRVKAEDLSWKPNITIPSKSYPLGVVPLMASTDEGKTVDAVDSISKISFRELAQ